MRKLTILAALLVAACGAGPASVISTTASTVTVEQAGGTKTPSATVADAAEKACNQSGKHASFASATQPAGGPMQYLYFCH